MSLNIERKSALKKTYFFLYDLLDPAKGLKASRKIRYQATDCLRHYPEPFRVDEIRFKRKDISGR